MSVRVQSVGRREREQCDTKTSKPVSLGSPPFGTRACALVITDGLESTRTRTDLSANVVEGKSGEYEYPSIYRHLGGQALDL